MPGDAIVVESDLLYESRGLDRVLAHGWPDATLVSGFTGAGDEVWVEATAGRLSNLSKRRTHLASVAGEFVGISKLSARTAGAMCAAYDRMRAADRLSYETDALALIAASQRVDAVLVPDLRWGEIDDERQLRRVTDVVWPIVSLEELACDGVMRPQPHASRSGRTHHD
jgi:choline kinase